MTTLCPCGSGLEYEVCCGRYHQGAAVPTAEALMRSRYSAYALQLADYLFASWHPSTRPESLTLGGEALRWFRLEILSTNRGVRGDEEGAVEFRAHWLNREGRCGTLREQSRFVQESGRWYYLDGLLIPEAEHKVGRNEPCPCGSGRKYKQCCGR